MCGSPERGQSDRPPHTRLFGTGFAYPPARLVFSPSPTSDSASFTAAPTPSTTGSPSFSPTVRCSPVIPAHPRTSTSAPAVPHPLGGRQERGLRAVGVTQVENPQSGADDGGAVAPHPRQLQAVLDLPARPLQRGHHAVAAAEQTGQMRGGLGDVDDGYVHQLPDALPSVLAEARHDDGVVGRPS